MEILDYLKKKFPKMYRPNRVVDKLSGLWISGRGPNILKLKVVKPKRWWEELEGADDGGGMGNAIGNLRQQGAITNGSDSDDDRPPPPPPKREKSKEEIAEELAEEERDREFFASMERETSKS